MSAQPIGSRLKFKLEVKIFLIQQQILLTQRLMGLKEKFLTHSSILKMILIEIQGVGIAGQRTTKDHDVRVDITTGASNVAPKKFSNIIKI